ncbi:SusD/RagB family nutrient-binding outer membrane lipoprotein [Niabella hibiscisoli]|uniref:SusD/RagB family nutrient-binding outer membrane lipoprotein n=1 Tax=Niabella hibiscisoli TaxID=1825928 RepID=UPI001F114692|nr:SusD/RagB family nutrient-binding outer membrane lipoprotein [Niabella hibiscisoli]MCH5718695.1 SusD/RagB family nutrient-binding outer membrane lipoprotein [Niabella hibiscisoli]
MLWAALFILRAFKARYTTPPLFTPKYETQEQLYTILDNELKASVAVLKSNLPNQQLYGTYDLFYHGTANEAQNWAMAANSLRLKIAMRMYKRKPAAAKAIIDEVLADNVGPINSRSASWYFKAGSNDVNGGNWATFASIAGPKGMVDFMRTNSDPRIRNFYKKTAITLTQFNAAKTAGTIPATATYDGDYVGRYIGAEALNQADKSFYFNNFPGANIMYPSEIQLALFNRAINQGLVSFPIIMYADVCFMRSELAARGITTENAEDWYKKGIEASIRDYNEWGSDAKVVGFTAVTDAEIAAYLNMPAIKYDAAKGVEQVCVQQYINFFKNPSEGWALRRRTGYPSTTGVVMPFERKTNLGNEIKMPRRWPINVPSISDFNYSNAKAAIEEMQKDPNFGNLTDITGRVWWDVP